MTTRVAPLRRAAGAWMVWLAVLLCVTVVLRVYRERLDKAHVALAFLLVVLGASAMRGRGLGITLAGIAFLLFNWFFLQPYNTFVIADALDWGVLVAFLVTGVTAAQLLERQRHHAEVAEQRASEIDRLAAAEDASETLRRRDGMKDALLAAVSHDLRTPLTAIKGIANEVWRGGDPTRARIIEDEADRLTVMVEDLLELSQLNAGGVTINLALNTVDDLIGAALARLEAAHGAGRIQVMADDDGALLVGRFDFSHAVRTLTNLLENALKYSPASTPITIRVARAAASIELGVEDRGPGVDPGDASRIFEPFFRGRGVPPGIRGTGLGLAIARQLAEAQHGTVTYAPRAGGGSCFAFVLPAADPVIAT